MKYHQIDKIKNIFKKIIIFKLRTLSRLVLWKYKPKIVAITGTVGKTSTKDAVYAALSQFEYVRKSEKSYNSEIGLPLTILGIPNGWNNPSIWIKNIFKGLWLFLWPHTYPTWLVLEVGVGKPGDMKQTASWLKTDAVIITAIGELPVHIEFFESRDHLIKEKSGLIDTLKKDGALILNADDPAVLAMKTNAKRRSFTYGFQQKADIKGGSEQIFYSDEGIPQGINFRIDTEGNSLPVFIEGGFGKNHIYAVLAALAFASVEKLHMLTAINALRKYDFPAGRMRLLKGINDSLIIDDTYNSSPFAAETALQTLGEVKVAGRKIAVLGDMLELGRHTVDAHRRLGELAKEYADIVVVVGARAKATAERALDLGMSEKKIFTFDTAILAGDFLKNFVSAGDLLLVKGSQGVRMERIVGAIVFEQDKKKELLVRQDEEWIKKQ